MPPVSSRTFYSQRLRRASDGESSAASSSYRWLAKTSDGVVVPPSDDDASTFLSAPSSGFSSPKGKVGANSPMFSMVRPKVDTRFTRTLHKKNLLNDFVKIDCSILSPQVVPLSFAKRCSTWIESVKSATSPQKENNSPASSRTRQLSSLCERKPAVGGISQSSLRSPLKILQSCSPRAKPLGKNGSFSITISGMEPPPPPPAPAAAAAAESLLLRPEISEESGENGKGVPLLSSTNLEDSHDHSPITQPKASLSTKISGENTCVFTTSNENNIVTAAPATSANPSLTTDIIKEPTDIPPESSDLNNETIRSSSKPGENEEDVFTTSSEKDIVTAPATSAFHSLTTDIINESNGIPSESSDLNNKNIGSSSKPGENEEGISTTSNEINIETASPPPSHKPHHEVTPDFFHESYESSPKASTHRKARSSSSKSRKNGEGVSLPNCSSTPNKASSLPEENKKGTSRPFRRCRLADTKRSSDNESGGEEEYGNFFPSDAFNSSGGSDNYIPNTSSDRSSNVSEVVSEPLARTRARKVRPNVESSPADEGSHSPASPRNHSPATSSDETSPLQDKSPRKKGTSELLKTNRKLRNSGSEYTTLKGRLIKARTLKPLNQCRSKCATKLHEEGRNEIFNEYWALNDFDKRVNYIASHVFEDSKKCVRKRDEESSRNRSVTLRYELEQNNTRVKVCKKCFLATLDENDGFVKRVLLNKKKSYSGVTATDRRGRKPCARKTPEEILDCVRNHINSFPKYVSHYGRSQSSKQYLGADLSVNAMFEMYRKGHNPQVSHSTYFREFQKTGLKFKPPAVDTCSKCDGYKQALKQCKSAEDKVVLEEERSAHHKKADGAFAAKRSDKSKAEEDPSKQVICFDLEQVLPCPLLSSGETFYKRQLSVYNLTVYNCSSKTGTNYMWSELEAGRGANEISSCLTRYIKEEIAEPVTHLTMYSDTCSGQNKNSHMCAALIAVMKDHPSLHTIDQKFLVPGHTFMECDQIHAQIEKKKKRATAELHHPSDWFNFVRTVPYKNSNLLVREMKQQHFLDYASLLIYKKQGPLVMREKDSDGERFLFAPVQWFRYQKENPANVLFKSDLQSETPFKNISFRRRGKLGNNALKPNQCYDQKLPISILKKRDLLALLPQINQIYHEFYKSLPASDKATDVDPDCIPRNHDVAEELRATVADC